MNRHFFLRLPNANHFPVACIAAEIASVQPKPSGTDATFDFAVATYNPADEGILPFSKKEGRARAYGRLNSSNHRIRLTLSGANFSFDHGFPPAIIKAICEDMIHGTWHERHPAAAAAKAAARHWLHQSMSPATPTAYAQIENIPVAVTFTREQEAEAIAIDAARSNVPLAGWGSNLGETKLDPSIKEAIMTAGMAGPTCNCMSPTEWHRVGSPGCTLGVVSSAPPEPLDTAMGSQLDTPQAVEAAQVEPEESELTINTRPEDEAMLDRIFGKPHHD